MRDYAKVGGRKGLPGYRTPASFRYKNTLKVIRLKKSMQFGDKVLDVVSKIPKGETMTYKKVAELSGSPKAFRAVGNILSKNYDPSVPCHRVIKADGGLGGYNRGAKRKKELLKKEGVL